MATEVSTGSAANSKGTTNADSPDGERKPTVGPRADHQRTLAQVGIRVSPRTVARYLPKGPAGQPRGDLRWSTFLKSHATAILACDFFVVVTATFRTLYVFVVIEHGTRLCSAKLSSDGHRHQHAHSTVQARRGCAVPSGRPRASPGPRPGYRRARRAGVARARAQGHCALPTRRTSARRCQRLRSTPPA